jgi:aspartyl protease family protein
MRKTFEFLEGVRLPALLLVMLCPGVSWGGAHDYYECVAADGTVAFSTARCAKGEKQRRIEDDTPPVNAPSGMAKGGMVRLESARGGHFYTTLHINGVAVRGVVDTGASALSLSPATARRVGLDLQRGVQTRTYTANGVAPATEVVLNTVELGGNTLRGIRGLVTSQELGPQVEALIGMTLLTHFEVNTDGYRMTLRPK